MFLELVEDLSDYLGVNDHDLDDTLKYLTLFTFAPLGCVGTFLSAINIVGTAELIGRFGLRKNIFDLYPEEIPLNDNNPVAKAVKTRSLIWVDEVPTWNNPAEINNFDDLLKEIQSFIAWPVERNHSPIATLSIFCTSEVERTSEVQAYLKAVNSIFSVFFNKSKNGAREIQQDRHLLNSARLVFEGRQLTERQSQILQLMAEGKTNLAISQILGFSESTIRQESIRIYEKLRCDGRKEAALIFNELKREAAVS